MDNAELNLLEVQYATKDVRVFNALRELRLELRVITRAYNELYAEKYPRSPPIFGHVSTS